MTVFLDANVFLRYLVAPASPETQAMRDFAAELFAAIARGDEEGATSEAVIAEVAFVLTSPRQYRLSPAAAAELLAPILRTRGLHVLPTHKRHCLRALDLWAEHPRLDFVDALTVSTVQENGMRLATFDGDFDAFSNIERWRPAER
jgi:predicted nucleic acid-binding protein